MAGVSVFHRGGAEEAEEARRRSVREDRTTAERFVAVSGVEGHGGLPVGRGHRQFVKSMVRQSLVDTAPVPPMAHILQRWGWWPMPNGFFMVTEDWPRECPCGPPKAMKTPPGDVAGPMVRRVSSGNGVLAVPPGADSGDGPRPPPAQPRRTASGTMPKGACLRSRCRSTYFDPTLSK